MTAEQDEKMVYNDYVNATEVFLFIHKLFGNKLHENIVYVQFSSIFYFYDYIFYKKTKELVF